MIIFLCPACKNQFQVPDNQGGTKTNCSTCGQRIRVPLNKNKTVPGLTLPVESQNLPSTEFMAESAFEMKNAGAASTEVASQDRSDSNDLATIIPVAAADSWFYMHAGQRHGPVSFEQLTQLARSSQALLDDLVWFPTVKAWKPLREIAGLFQASESKAATNEADQIAFATKKSRRIPSALVHLGNRLRRRPRILLALGAGAAGLGFVLLGASIISSMRGGTAPHSSTGKGPVAALQNKDSFTSKMDAEAGKTGKEWSVEETVARFEQAVALIETPLGHGTGFVIGPNLLVTSAHVIDLVAIPHLKVHFPAAGNAAKKSHSVDRLAFFDRKRDLAILEIKTAVNPVPLAAAYQLKRGQTVTVMGNPGLGRGTFKLENAVAKGIVSTEAHLPSGKFLQLNVSVNPGNSGGPVFSPFGEVIGVIQSRGTEREAIAFAIPIADVIEALEKIKDMTAESKEQLTSKTNARAVFIRTAKAASLYYEGTGFIELGCQEGFKRFKNIQPSDWEAGQRVFRENLRKRNQEFVLEMKDINEAITIVGSDPLLSDATRQRLADLWKTYDGFRLDYPSPVLPLASYSARCQRNLLALEEQMSSLRVILGVEQHELDLKSPK